MCNRLHQKTDDIQRVKQVRTRQTLLMLCYGLVYACRVRDVLQAAARVGRSPRWIPVRRLIGVSAWQLPDMLNDSQGWWTLV
jgi:hypothetical protein